MNLAIAIDLLLQKKNGPVKISTSKRDFHARSSILESKWQFQTLQRKARIFIYIVDVSGFFSRVKLNSNQVTVFIWNEPKVFNLKCEQIMSLFLIQIY